MKGEKRFFLLREKGMTFREIGIHFGFTPARARQLYIKAKELKELLNRRPFSSRLSVVTGRVRLNQK